MLTPETKSADEMQEYREEHQKLANEVSIPNNSNETDPLMAIKSADEIAAEEILDYHGCLTGDCPHDKQRDCFKSLVMEGLAHRDREIERVRNHWISTCHMLTDQSRELVEGLEFYANRDNYDLHQAWGKVCIVEKDTELGVWNDRPELGYENIRTGGKLARQVLARQRGENGK